MNVSIALSQEAGATPNLRPDVNVTYQVLGIQNKLIDSVPSNPARRGCRSIRGPTCSPAGASDRGWLAKCPPVSRGVSYGSSPIYITADRWYQPPALSFERNSSASAAPLRGSPARCSKRTSNLATSGRFKPFRCSLGETRPQGKFRDTVRAKLHFRGPGICASGWPPSA